MLYYIAQYKIKNEVQMKTTKDKIVFKKSQYGQVNLYMIENLLRNNGISPLLTNYNVIDNGNTYEIRIKPIEEV